jgi:hypothetical protein
MAVPALRTKSMPKSARAMGACSGRMPALGTGTVSLMGHPSFVVQAGNFMFTRLP